MLSDDAKNVEHTGLQSVYTRGGKVFCAQSQSSHESHIVKSWHVESDVWQTFPPGGRREKHWFSTDCLLPKFEFVLLAASANYLV